MTSGIKTPVTNCGFPSLRMIVTHGYALIYQRLLVI